MRQTPKNRWFNEWLSPHERHAHRLRRTVVRRRTKFQNAVIADTFSFGRCLILDGEMQSAQRDEFIYHEALVHPALVCHPNPESILVLGGGEGATARELLKHATVRRVTMVDIDGDVVAFCKKHMEPWHRGAFDDKRVRLLIGDAKSFIETAEETFDVIIADLPSPALPARPANGSPVNALYAPAFYRRLSERLKPGGLFVTQAGSGDLIQLKIHQGLHAAVRRIFPVVRPYYAHVPSFDVPWAFLIGSQKRDPLAMSARRADGIVRRRISGALKFYDGMTHAGLFNIPKHMRALLDI